MVAQRNENPKVCRNHKSVQKIFGLLIYEVEQDYKRQFKLLIKYNTNLTTLVIKTFFCIVCNIALDELLKNFRMVAIKAGI